MTREADIERHFVARVKGLGGKALKLMPASMAGLPDRLVLFPGGRMFFCELKVPGRKPTRLQERTHAWLRSWGFVVLVIDGREGVDDLIRGVIGEVATA